MRQQRRPLASLRLTLAIEEPASRERAEQWAQVAPEYIVRGGRLYRLNEADSTPTERRYEWAEGLHSHTIWVVRPPPGRPP